MKDTYYYVTTPPRVGKLQAGQVLDHGDGYPTFEAAQAGLVKALRKDIWIYRTWIRDTLQTIAKVKKQTRPFEL